MNCSLSLLVLVCQHECKQSSSGCGWCLSSHLLVQTRVAHAAGGNFASGCGGVYRARQVGRGSK